MDFLCILTLWERKGVDTFLRTGSIRVKVRVILQIVEEPKLKKCVIKGDNWSVKGPTKNLYPLKYTFKRVLYIQILST